MENYQAELCPIDYYTIRLTVLGETTRRRHFFVPMDIAEKFNKKVMMKTRHKAGQSWSVIPSTTLKVHLETCVPQEIHDLMTAWTNTRLVEARVRCLAQLAALQVTNTDTDIVNCNTHDV